MEFRKIKYSDQDLIYTWANDPVTRNNSYSTQKISYPEHIKWFNSKINDESCQFLLFHKKDSNIGFVRFDKDKKDKWVISINIAPDHRGKGLASKMLKHGIEYIRNIDDEPIIAFIKKTNIASVKAFERAGFKLEKNLTYKNLKSYMYICR